MLFAVSFLVVSGVCTGLFVWLILENAIDPDELKTIKPFTKRKKGLL